jgi:hypothetical protein
MMGDNDDIRRMLAEGADPNAVGDKDHTPLQVAAVYGRTEAIDLLLAGGADPNQTDPHGNGALWTAVLSAPKEVRVEIITRLLEAGADPDHKNRYGRSPRDAATTIGYGLELPFAVVPTKHAAPGTSLGDQIQTPKEPKGDAVRSRRTDWGNEDGR